MRKAVTKCQWSIQCDRRMARFLQTMYVLCYTKTNNRNSLHALRKTSAAVAVHNVSWASFIETRPFKRSRWRNVRCANDVRQTVENKKHHVAAKLLPPAFIVHMMAVREARARRRNRTSRLCLRSVRLGQSTTLCQLRLSGFLDLIAM